MEERLLFVGVAFFGYAWLSAKLKERKQLDSATKTGLWHALFTALAGFSITLVLVMSMDTHTTFVSVAVGTITTTELYSSLAAGLLCAAVGFWRGRSSWEKPETREHFLTEDSEWADTIWSAVLLAWLLMSFVVQAFKIPSSSMESTLLIGDHLFVNKFVYGLRVPFTGKRLFTLRPVERGDVIVFQFPDDDSHVLHCGSVQYRKDFIKRVIGVPGDVMQVKEGRLMRNGKEVGQEPYTQYLDGDMRMPKPETQPDPQTYQEVWQTHRLDAELENVEHYAYGPRDYFGPVTVPPNAYFAMGDNRDKSCDSRYWGPVEARFIKGKAWFIYWPPNRMRLVR